MFIIQLGMFLIQFGYVRDSVRACSCLQELRGADNADAAERRDGREQNEPRENRGSTSNSTCRQYSKQHSRCRKPGVGTKEREKAQIAKLAFWVMKVWRTCLMNPLAMLPIGQMAHTHLPGTLW